MPRITKGTLPESGNSIAIYADCTASMKSSDTFLNMVEAISAVWPIENARLFGFSDESCDIYEVISPHKLSCTKKGTCFEPMLRHASKINAKMTLIFSDGEPYDRDEMWRVWRETSFPIATHLCYPTRLLTDNAFCVAVMRGLCRGGGGYTFGVTLADMDRGVGRSLPEGSRRSARAC